MEQTVRQCNIRITARYTSNFFISHIYLYNNIYFSLVCASCAFHEDFRLDRSFDFCEKRRYSSFCAFCSVRNIFFRFSVFSFFFFVFFPLSFFRRFKPRRTRDVCAVVTRRTFCFLVALKSLG